MCAIVDASVADDIFGQTRTPAGVEFFKWIDSGHGRMVSGGTLHEELKRRSGFFRRWEREARLAGRLAILNPVAVEDEDEAAQEPTRYTPFQRSPCHRCCTARRRKAAMFERRCLAGGLQSQALD